MYLSILFCTLYLCVTATLVRTFMFLGFAPLAPGSPLVPASGDLMFMATELEAEEGSDLGDPG